MRSVFYFTNYKIKRRTMGWWIYFLIVFTISLLLVPKSEWKKLFIMGLIGVVIILAIDSSLIFLGAFKFNYTGIKMLGLPLPYWISYIPGGMLFAHFYPTVWIQRMLYILIAAASFALVEFIVIQVGLFQHLNWNIFNAFILNIGGFTIFSWFTEWFYFESKKVKIY